VLRWRKLSGQAWRSADIAVVRCNGFESLTPRYYIIRPRISMASVVPRDPLAPPLRISLIPTRPVLMRSRPERLRSVSRSPMPACLAPDQTLSGGPETGRKWWRLAGMVLAATLPVGSGRPGFADCLAQRLRQAPGIIPQSAARSSGPEAGYGDVGQPVPNPSMVGRLMTFERIAVGRLSKKFIQPYGRTDPAVSRRNDAWPDHLCTWWRVPCLSRHFRSLDLGRYRR
jgi:hypothetical protein